MSANTEKLLARLGGMSAFSPMSVSTFADWSLDVGDTIRVREIDNGKRASVMRTMPIFHQDISWNGAATGEISCTGEEKRPVEKQADRDEQRFRKTTNKKLASLDSNVSSLSSKVSSLSSSLGKEQSVGVVTYIGTSGAGIVSYKKRTLTFYGSVGSESTNNVVIV